MQITRDHAQVAVKVGAVLVGGLVAPGVGHCLGGLLGGAAIVALMGENAPGGKWMQSLGDHVALGLADKFIDEHRQAQGAKANGHVAKLLLTAAADAIEGARDVESADCEIAQAMAKGLRGYANTPARVADFFVQARQAVGDGAPSEQEIWKNIQSPEALESAYWASLRDALATAVMHLPRDRKSDVERILDALKAPIIEGMGKALVTVIQTDEQIRTKLDTYFKAFVAKSLTEQSQLIQALGSPTLRSFDFEPDEEWRTRNRFRADADWTTYQPIAEVEDALDGFIDDEGRVRWFVLTGAGGAGKSRAARERARACLERGWRVWEYGGGSHGPAEGKETREWRNWKIDRPTLVVVDYASACPIRVADAIRELQGRAGGLEHPVRFLLLERAYGSGVTWVDAFEKEGGSGLAKAKHGAGSLAAPILTEADYLAIAKGAYEKRAAMGEGGTWAKSGAGGDLRPWPGEAEAKSALRQVFDGREETDEDARPLYAMFAGEAIADRGLDHLGEWNATDLVKFVLRREIDRWGGEGGADEAHLNLLLLATLCGGLSESDFGELRKDGKFGLPRPGELHPDCYRRLVMPRTGGAGAEYGPLLPDLLGELFAFERLVGGCLLSADSERALAEGPAWALLEWAASVGRGEAGALLAKAAQDFPDHAAVEPLFATQGDLLSRGFFARGMALLGRGEFKRSLREWKLADRAAPGNSWILTNWGAALAEMADLAPEGERWGLYERACEKYELAVKANPGYAMAYYNWGIALVHMAALAPPDKRQALYRRACEKYEGATKADPDDAKAHFNWGVALALMADCAPDDERYALYQEACEKYRVAVTAHPDDPRAHTNWGAALAKMAAIAPQDMRQDLYQQACEKFEAATMADPDLAGAFFDWGNVLVAMASLSPEREGEDLYEQACEKYRAATRADPGYSEAYFVWGVALTKMAALAPEDRREALYHEACEKYEAAVKANPDYAVAHLCWAVALVEMAALAPKDKQRSLLEDARAKAARACELAPQDADMRGLLELIEEMLRELDDEKS